MIDLEAEIKKILENYKDDVDDKLDQATVEVANLAVSQLHSTSPKHTGGYAGGWTSKSVPKSGGKNRTVYNSTKPGLTHILEKGWIMRNGKRHGAVKVHIKPVEEMVNSQFVSIVERLI